MFNNFVYKVKQTVWVWLPNGREKAIKAYGKKLARLFGGEYQREQLSGRPEIKNAGFSTIKLNADIQEIEELEQECISRLNKNISALSKYEWNFALDRLQSVKKYMLERRDLHNKLPDGVTQQEVDENSIKHTESAIQEVSLVMAEANKDENNKQ